MKIFSVSLSPHDHNTYDGVFHNQRERYTRLKHNVPSNKKLWDTILDQYTPEELREEEANTINTSAEFYDQYFKPNEHEVLAFTTTIGGLKRIKQNKIKKEFLQFNPKSLWDYKMIGNQYYIDHHQSHALYAFLTSGFTQSDILAVDGRGWNFRCIFIDKSGKITNLSSKINIGEQWNRISQLLGFGNLGAGKLMGLAAYGNYDPSLHLAIETENYKFLEKNKNDLDKKDVAATLQDHTIELMHEHILPLKSCDNICIAGGVAYNGYMNEDFTKYYDNVHIPPAPGDEGQTLGTYMHADFSLNKNTHIPNTYSGAEYDFDAGEFITPEEVGKAISDGNIVGWFNGKAESGNRALGNRSILADPRNPKIKDIINQTIKLREDFRPFAPAVMEEHYQTYFDTKQPSPFMSRIVPVKSDKIPGVTHIDKTARIQTVNIKQNEKFYRVIEGFYKSTGIPMVLNTSFNCREPIVETPEQAINTFNRTELDMVVINGRYLSKGKKNEYL